MKLKNYKELFEQYDSPEDDDDLYGRPSYSSKKIHSGYDPDEDDEIQGDDMEHLLYLLRSLFKNTGVDVEIEHKGLDIMIYAVLNKKEKMKTVLKIFDVAKKLKKDILAQYDSEFELWETKSGHPMLTFNFFYDDGDGDDNAAFSDNKGNIPF